MEKRIHIHGLRLPEELHTWLCTQAEAEHRTLSNMLLVLVARAKLAQSEYCEGPMDAEKEP